MFLLNTKKGKDLNELLSKSEKNKDLALALHWGNSGLYLLKQRGIDIGTQMSM